MPVDDVTIGELGRRLSAMEGRINSQFVDVNRRLDSLQFVTREVYETDMRARDRRIDELEEDRKWNRRTFVAAFLYPTAVAIVLILLAMGR
jgi:hypothetical protein